MIKINRLIRYAKSHKEGFSINVKNDKIRKIKATKNKRYIVAGLTLIEIYEDHYFFYSQNLKLLNFNNNIGGYYNEKLNCYQIELILVLKYKLDAMETGKRYNQISIYDLLEGREIVLNDIIPPRVYK